MHIHVNGRNLEITDAIKAYVKEILGKVTNHYDQIQAIDVILSVIKNPAASGKHIAKLYANLHLEQSIVKNQPNQCMQASICWLIN